MGSTWKTVRVFISSTFRDMHAERDHLVRVVFPELRERLEAHRIHLINIDLRWGVTIEQADNDQVLDLCLDQIDRCRPFFIGILGQRYGWVPEHLPDLDNPHLGWVQGMTGKSITELEILHGVLNNPAMHGHAMFYFRDGAYLADVPEDQRTQVYTDEHSDALEAVKKDIRTYCGEHDAPLREYPCRWDPERPNREDGTVGRLTGLELFGQGVRDDLWNAIARVHPEILQPPAPPAEETSTESWLAEELDAHRRFMESRTVVYVGRRTTLDRLGEYVLGDDDVPCLVSGGAGSGKSALLSKFVEEYERTHSDTLVIPHFVGASPRSSDLRLLLRRLCLILADRFGAEDKIPEDAPALSSTFRDLLAKAPADRPVLIVLDGLDQLDQAHRAHDLYWLPWDLPASVKILTSCAKDVPTAEPRAEGDADGAGPVEGEASRPEQDAAASPLWQALRHRRLISVPVQPLTDDERHEIIRDVPSLSAKTLDDNQVALLLDNPATRNPLFLLVALEELRGFGSFERLNERIAQFPRTGDTTTDLFCQVIDRLAADFDADLVCRTLTSLAAARRGLSQRELRELTADLDTADELFPVLRQLRTYLLYRGDLIGFYHRSLGQAVGQACLDAPDKQAAAHTRLAEYFGGQDYFLESLEEQRARVKRLPPTPRPANVRKVDELPYHLLEVAKILGGNDAKSEHWDAVADLLMDWQFLEAKAEAQA